jgi:hypothetical protein
MDTAGDKTNIEFPSPEWIQPGVVYSVVIADTETPGGCPGEAQLRKITFFWTTEVEIK